MTSFKSIILTAGLAVALGVSSAQDAAPADPALDLYYSANGLYNRNLHELAAQRFQEFLTKHPAHPKAPHARLGLALSFFALGKHADAAPLLTQLVADPAAPERDQARLLLGQALLAQGKGAEAERVFTEAAAQLKESAGKEKALAGLIEALQAQKKWKELVARQGELAALAPVGSFTARAQFQGGLAHFELKQYKEAAELLEKLKSPDAPYAQHALLMLGEAKRELGDLAGAAKAYEQAARSTTSALAAEALFRLGFARFRQGSWDEAIKSLQELRTKHKDHPAKPQAMLYLGRAHLGKKQFGEAEAVLREVAANPEASVWLARALVSQKKFPEAAEALGGAVPKLTGSPLLRDALFDYGSALLGAEKLDEAQQAFARMLKEFPDHVQAADAMRLRASALHRLKRYKESVQQADEFLARYAKDAAAGEVAFLRAEGLLLGGTADQALAAYRAILQANAAGDQGNAARLRMGEILYGQKKWNEVENTLQTLATQSGNAAFAKIPFMLGIAQFEQGKWDAAIESLQRFISQQPKAATADSALLTLGLAHARKGNRDGAIGALQKLASEFAGSPHRRAALLELGRLSYEAKQFSTARQALEELVKSGDAGKEKVPAKYYLAWVALSENKSDEAARHFGAAADESPRHELAADSRLQQALLLLRKGPEAAEAALARFTADYPFDPRLDRVLLELGGAYASQQRWQDAVKQLRRLSEQFPASPLRERALYQLAWAEKGLKQPQGAQQAYETLLTAYPQSTLAEAATLELAELQFEAKAYDAVIARLGPLSANGRAPEFRARALYQLGWAQSQKAQTLDAANTWETLLAQAPPADLVARAAFQAGEARLKLKEYQPALVHFQRAAADAYAGDITPQAVLRVGETQSLLGQFTEAEQTYAAFLQRFASHELARQAHFGIGWARENQKRPAEAIDAYRSVLATGMKDEIAARSQFQIGESLFALGRFDEAIKELMLVEVGYGFPVWSSKALLEIGRALDRKGARPQAVERFQEVVSRYPGTDAAAVASDLMQASAGAATR